MRMHAVRKLVPVNEFRDAFTWHMFEERAWSGWIAHGATRGHALMDTSLYLSDTPNYRWFNFGGVSSLAMIIMTTLAIAIITVFIICIKCTRSYSRWAWSHKESAEVSKTSREIHNLVAEDEITGSVNNMNMGPASLNSAMVGSGGMIGMVDPYI